MNDVKLEPRIALDLEVKVESPEVFLRPIPSRASSVSAIRVELAARTSTRLRTSRRP